MTLACGSSRTIPAFKRKSVPVIASLAASTISIVVLIWCRWVPQQVDELACEATARKNLIVVEIDSIVAKLDRFEIVT